MELRYYLPAAVLSVMILTHCRQPIENEYKVFADFPVSVELSHKPINIDNPIMYPSGIIFLDSALVVLDISGDYFLNFFTLDDFAFISRSIRRGRGPMEEESIFGISNALGKNKFWYKTHSGIKSMRYMPGKDEPIPMRFFKNCDSFQGNTYLLGNGVLGIPYTIHDKVHNKEFVKISADDCVLVDGFRISDFTNEIHVFDWDGQPVKRIVLDKSIFAFGVSPDDKTLVAITMSDPDVLLTYDLSSATK